MQMYLLENPLRNHLTGSKVWSTATRNRQTWGHSASSGLSCGRVYLLVHLSSCTVLRLKGDKPTQSW